MPRQPADCGKWPGLQIPALAMGKRTERVNGNSGLLQRRAKALRRFCKRLQCQLECNLAEPDRLPGAKVLQDLNCLFWVAMRLAHEFAKFVGPGGNSGEFRRGTDSAQAPAARQSGYLAAAPPDSCSPEDRDGHNAHARRSGYRFSAGYGRCRLAAPHVSGH